MTRADWLLLLIVLLCLPLLYVHVWRPAGTPNWLEIQAGDGPGQVVAMAPDRQGTLSQFALPRQGLHSCRLAGTHRRTHGLPAEPGQHPAARSTPQVRCREFLARKLHQRPGSWRWTGFGAVTYCIRNGNAETDVFRYSNMCISLAPNATGAIFGLGTGHPDSTKGGQSHPSWHPAVWSAIASWQRSSRPIPA
jgi:hypothetical protein